MRRFTHTFPQRISAFLLCLALLVALLPTTAFALDGDNTIMLGTSGIKDPTAEGNTYYTPNSYIYFGVNESEPIKWRVLDADKANNGTTSGMFLLSEYLLGDTQFDDSSNVWQGSDAQKWCTDFASNSSNFSTAEQSAMQGIAKEDSSETLYSVPWGASSLTEQDKMFFLSARELTDYVGDYDGAPGLSATDTEQIAGYWWLRSPYAYLTSYAGLVIDIGDVYFRNVPYDWAARPAFNLNLNSVLFTSAAEGGKSTAAASGGNQGGVGADAIFEINDTDTNEWKLTLLDDNHKNFSISDAKKENNTVSFSYNNAQTGTNEYISVVIEDKGEITHYGRILKLDDTTNGANGRASLALPEGVTLDENTKLYVFNEQYNGDKMTDYASLLWEFDTTAPTLSNGSATRTGETTATVKFISDEAGEYFYEVVESGTTAPTINTAGTGTSCASGENTISLTSLSGAGAKDIYIVAKDAVGNVSSSLKITIPAIYTLTVNLNGGSGSTADGEYTEGTAVPIDAGSRSNYRFAGWTSSNGGSFASASSASTTFTMPAADTTITANWQYDSPYIPPSKPNWTSVARKLANAQPGDTVTVKMNGETEVPGEVWETIAGRDVTVILDMGGNVSWTVEGNDVPTATHFADMDFGVDRNTTGIDVDVINAITGEVSSVQITLAHDGEFGFALTLTAPLGRENAGRWANLYHYNEDAESLSYETSGEIQEDGTASLKMTHASQYAIVIDEKSHQLPFTDVTSGTWYEGAVRYAYLHDIMEGMSATTFQPNGTLSRAMAVQIFYNLEGQPDISDENLGYPYEDVNAEEWYGDAVYWARLTGVATGYGDGTFHPSASITRQEFAQMLYNYAKHKGYDLTAAGDLSTFPDSGSVADWAEAAMSWANGNQLINGHDDGTIDAAGIGTRAQAASILMRFDQNLVKN
ncbi:S-layer homology domain-containing protein [Acutalibacter sp. LFL-21]|uniref:S-layer homology domain-containing protein n=1 Tax=Acutalibacter sp. LFL-21 TaxID=2983399 RepID=UPI0021D65459|nr:S-layer homology domain-containing protein [Acutalibacter sp. LFL-21]MCU7651786.1 S-layer homology domain-containing protein [Acutalibacter sp. LFL-21]